MNNISNTNQITPSQHKTVGTSKTTGYVQLILTTK